MERSTTRPDSGAALFEFAIVLPILLSFILLVVDLGNALSDYQLFVDVASAGLRYGQQLNGLEITALGTPPEPGLRSTLNISPCNGSFQIDKRDIEGDLTYTPPDRHLNLHNRLAQLLCLQLQGNSLIKLTRIKFTSFLQPPPPIASEDEDSLRIRLSAEYEPFFPLFPNLPISTSITGPFLY